MKPVWQRVARLNFDGTCFVENSKGQKYMVNIPDYCEGVRTGDSALVQKSPVSGEWNMLDYSIHKHDCEAPVDGVESDSTILTLGDYQ